MGMRKQDNVIIWPAYFDATRTRKDGRRVAKSLAVPTPRVAEIKESADKLRLESELVADVGYSKTPWLKAGMVLVKRKKETKEQIIRNIARQLLKIRSTVATKQ
jgi:signal recognition particle subunit SRP19